MTENQKRAWEWLLEKEQHSLFLTLGQGKSSWEVGEILGLSHYKYLEIKERAEVFFKLFTNFLERWPSLFRPGNPCQESFKDLMDAFICRRVKRKSAALFSGDAANLVKRISTASIRNNLKVLSESDDPWDKDTMALILEFDRWNNFRILPHEWQQPSAYKRRLNKKDKIYIKYLLDPVKTPFWMLKKIKERFYYKGRKAENTAYVALISKRLFKEGYLVMPIRKDPEVIKEMTGFYMYVFDSKYDADSLGFKISNYYIQTSRVRLGQKFWPEYREIVQRALNYNEMNNINFSRDNLDMARDPSGSIKKARIKTKKRERGIHDPRPIKSLPVTRADSSAFYIEK